MKLKSLKIKEYKHLKNLDFDFTYQSGAKKGQPLEKICFIGQSATGKSTLLNLIYDIRTKYNTLNQRLIDTSHKDFPDIEFFFINESNSIFLRKVQNQPEKITEGLIENTLSLKGYFFNCDLFHKRTIQNLFDDNFFISVSGGNVIENYKGFNNNNGFLKISAEYREIWNYILHEIYNYKTKLSQIGLNLVHGGSLNDLNKFKLDVETWKQNNPNPLSELAEKCLNPILNKLQLEVDQLQSKSLIPIKRINSDELIDSVNLSTGTIQLLLYLLPLYKLPTSDTIILVDEPERSLYPDLQIDLIKNFTNLAPNAQFIIATHSPFIASAFEPDERFILYFEEDGTVNYKLGRSPIGDDPNDILDTDFMIKPLTNDHGVKAHQKYRELLGMIRESKNEKDKNELLVEATKLGNLYNF